jgi:hypothetical protein
MAVGTQQHALPGLCPHLADTPSHALVTEMKVLCRSITVMELECGLMLVESTEPALTASLFDKLALDLPTASGYRGDIALQTPETAVGALEEGCMAMLLTS